MFWSRVTPPLALCKTPWIMSAIIWWTVPLTLRSQTCHRWKTSWQIQTFLHWGNIMNYYCVFFSDSAARTRRPADASAAHLDCCRSPDTLSCWGSRMLRTSSHPPPWWTPVSCSHSPVWSSGWCPITPAGREQQRWGSTEMTVSKQQKETFSVKHPDIKATSDNYHGDIVKKCQSWQPSVSLVSGLWWLNTKIFSLL